MYIYLVRHAQTEANEQHYIQGQTNAIITEVGYEQAKITASFFKNCDLSALYSSPLGRTIETSKLIAEAADYDVRKIIMCKNLMEINLEPWAGKNIEDLYNNDSMSGYKIYKTDPESFVPLSGENFIDVQKRVVKAYNSILSTNQNSKNIVIVSHSVAIRTLILYINHLQIKNIWDFDVEPASITKIEYFCGKSQIQFIGLCPYIS